MSGVTPGGWIVNPFNAQIDSAQFDNEGDLIPICQMLWPTTLRSEAETQANARLIAAAPDLLAALEDFMPPGVNLNNPNVSDDLTIPIDVTMGELRKMAAAIARARGEV